MDDATITTIATWVGCAFFSILVGLFANKHKKNGYKYFLISFLLSPLLTFIGLCIMLSLDKRKMNKIVVTEKPVEDIRQY